MPGVFEAVRVIGMGYPDRLYFQVLGQFAQLLDKRERPVRNEEGNLEGEERASVELVLEKFGIEPASYALGYSKVFLKAGVPPLLLAMKVEYQAKKAVKLQASARVYIARGRRTSCARSGGGGWSGGRRQAGGAPGAGGRRPRARRPRRRRRRRRRRSASLPAQDPMACSRSATSTARRRWRVTRRVRRSTLPRPHAKA